MMRIHGPLCSLLFTTALAHSCGAINKEDLTAFCKKDADALATLLMKQDKCMAGITAPPSNRLQQCEDLYVSCTATGRMQILNYYECIQKELPMCEESQIAVWQARLQACEALMAGIKAECK